ncbi:MAG: acetylornithine deacetylase [Flavobacteriaceae bacterium]|nr:acetylornithine deacetylase [Flavobacteriaceae bacterium]|tara:strand:- start:3915 stop:5417 length:1503 start_codon:yes stop_codon:yes gene_type:complete
MKKFITIIFIFCCHINLLSQRKYEQSSKNEGIKTLSLFKEFLSIPNDGKNKQEILNNITWASDQLSQFAFERVVLETSSLPLLLANKIIDKKLPTIAFYMHLDGQAVDNSKWSQKSPWQPVIKRYDGEKWSQVEWDNIYSEENQDLRIFARSSSDDKGPFLMFLTALRVIDNYEKKPAFNIKLILDFEEEKSSPGLPEAVSNFKDDLKADMLLILDGPKHFSGKPTLVFGNRGIADITLTTYGPKAPQHSGHYGNYIPNPALRLSQVLASMKSEDGKVKIPGFYDGIKIDNEVQEILNNVPAAEESIKLRTKIKSLDKVGNNYQESIQYPSLNIRGLQSGWVGNQARTIIPSTAIAEIDVRLVLESNPERLIKLIKNHIKSLGYTIIDHDPSDTERMNFDKIMKMEYNIAYPAFRTPTSAPEGKWLSSILRKYYKSEPVLIRTSGGSVPISPFVNELGLPAIGIPTVNLDNNQHSPNENLRLGNYFEGIETFVSILLTKY